MTKGFTEAAKRMELRADILRGKKGLLYNPQISGDMQDAINNNADPSYRGSPAKDIALKSAQTWQHMSNRHILRIVSLLFANYRQYGCGGVTIAALVKVLENDKKKMRRHFAQVLHNPQ